MRHHLVVLHDQYLNLMLSGSKRIECRISTIRRPPFEAVSPGDLLWLKPPSRPVRAMAVAGRCLFRALRSETDLPELIEKYADQICAVDGFFRNAAEWARFISLIWIETVVLIGPMSIRKSDQRAWVALDRMPVPGMRVGSRITIRT
ncbi:MAG: ASCH domain-containing protein [Phycisphaerales bacterium]|nr:ASCH domain-containing protein [Phycisphaerales bacterium]